MKQSRLIVAKTGEHYITTVWDRDSLVGDPTLGDHCRDAQSQTRASR